MNLQPNGGGKTISYVQYPRKKPDELTEEELTQICEALISYGSITKPFWKIWRARKWHIMNLGYKVAKIDEEEDIWVIRRKPYNPQQRQEKQEKRGNFYNIIPYIFIFLLVLLILANAPLENLPYSSYGQ